MKCDFSTVKCERKVACLLSGLIVRFQIDLPDLYKAIIAYMLMKSNLKDNHIDGIYDIFKKFSGCWAS